MSRAALEKYGGHLSECRSMETVFDKDCTCGYSQALAALSAPEASVPVSELRAMVRLHLDGENWGGNVHVKNIADDIEGLCTLAARAERAEAKDPAPLCGCCGTHKAVQPSFCEACEPHVLPWAHGRAPWHRTYAAQHGNDCPNSKDVR